MLTRFQQIISVLFTKQMILRCGFVLLMISVFLVNSLHTSYPDEFDNILGGRYIAEGRIIYRDFFTHHGPVAYVLASILYRFSGQSFVRFRLVYGLFLLLLVLGAYLYLEKSVQRDNKRGKVSSYYWPFILLLGLFSTYIWGHMLLADSISAFLFVPVFVLLLTKSLQRSPLTNADLIFVSLFTFLVELTSLTYTYIVMTTIVYCLWYFMRFSTGIQKTQRIKSVIIALVTIISPYLFFALYLLTTHSLQAYLFQNGEFNLRYYIYNYPRPEGSIHINPLRYAVMIAYEFFNNYHVLMTRVRDFGFDFPLNVTFALANFTLLVYLVGRRRISLALFVAALLIYSNVRSNPLSFGETDYQSAVYAQLSLFNMIFILYTLRKFLNTSALSHGARATYTTLFILLGSYSVASSIFIVRKFNEKAFRKYMGQEALIYDGSHYARVINDIVKPDEYAWIGPFHFEDLLYMNAEIPSRYHILIPSFGRAAKIQQEMLEDFQRRLPVAIAFDKKFFILGSSPEQFAQFYTDFLKENYTTVFEYGKDGNRVFSVRPVSISFDIETQLYLRKDRVDELVSVLITKGWVRPVEDQAVSTFLDKRDTLR